MARYPKRRLTKFVTRLEKKKTYSMKYENFPFVSGQSTCKTKPVLLFIKLCNASVGCSAATAGQSSRRPTGKFRQTQGLARVLAEQGRFELMSRQSSLDYAAPSQRYPSNGLSSSRPGTENRYYSCTSFAQTSS